MVIAVKKMISQHENVVVLQNDNNENALHALVSINEGEIISKFNAGITQSFATYLTVQIGVNTHITLQPTHLQYINHSCSPNVFFDTTSMQLIALQNINVDDELTFFYPSTEWKMDQPFVCNCKSNNCLKLIQGAAFLEKADLNNYQLTNFIQEQLQNKNQSL